MRDVFLVRRGSSLHPLGAEDLEAIEEFPQRKPLRGKITQPRSVPHNGFFRAFVQEAFNAWPIGHRAKPASWEQLRAWLLVEAGHCRRHEVHVGEASLHTIKTVVEALRKFHNDEDRFFWFYIKDETLHMVRPLTIRFAEVGEEDFRIISEKVFKIIYDVTGLDADERHAEFLKANPEYQKKNA